MRSLRLPLVALAGLCALPSVASGYARGESNWNPATLPVTYRVNASTAPSTIGGDAAIAALDAGMASWAAPACTRWRTTNGGASTVTRAVTGDRRNDFLWITPPNAWPAELGPVNSVIGVTTPVWTSGGYYIDADIQFNAVGFTWSTDGRRGTVDTQSIATHEEGHFLGLDHSTQSSAVMYASYPGGIKRTLTSDDIGGVCAIYPSGVTIPDAGVVPMTDPCNRYTSCAGCTPVNNCGWCGASGMCVTSTMSGPTAGSCGSGFVWQPSGCTTTMPTVDAGTSDPCSRFTSCGGCTPYEGCGWCGATNRCQLGTTTGPNAGSCGSNWAWTTTQCTAGVDGGATGGTANFGEPCRTPTDCASGVLCVGSSATTAFCSRACTDDCTCPRGYACNGRLMTGQTVCVPGTNRCTATNDAGIVPPLDVGVRVDVGLPVDLGVIPGNDAGTSAKEDAGAVAMTDAGAPDTGSWMVTAPSDGCGCRVPGPASTSRAQGVWALAAMGAALTARRRRRR